MTNTVFASDSGNSSQGIPSDHQASPCEATNLRTGDELEEAAPSEGSSTAAAPSAGAPKAAAPAVPTAPYSVNTRSLTSSADHSQAYQEMAMEKTAVVGEEILAKQCQQGRAPADNAGDMAPPSGAPLKSVTATLFSAGGGTSDAAATGGGVSSGTGDGDMKRAYAEMKKAYDDMKALLRKSMDECVRLSEEVTVYWEPHSCSRIYVHSIDNLYLCLCHPVFVKWEYDHTKNPQHPLNCCFPSRCPFSNQIVRTEGEGREARSEAADLKEVVMSAKREAEAAVSREAAARRDLEDASRDVRRLQDVLQEEREQHAEVGGCTSSRSGQVEASQTPDISLAPSSSPQSAPSRPSLYYDYNIGFRNNE